MSGKKRLPRSVESEEDLEEERRLFYVASTRAQQNLYLLTPELESRSWSPYDPSGIIFSRPSRFIEEIPGFEQLTESWALDFDDEEPF